MDVKLNGNNGHSQLRRVITEDETGRKWAWHVPDNLSDEEAEQGMFYGPPDITQLDWDAIQVEIHNKMVDRGIFSSKDITTTNTLTNIVGTTIVPKIIQFMKMEEIIYD